MDETSTTPRSVLWPWPYLFVAGLMALTGYSFYRLGTSPVYAAPTPDDAPYSAIAYSPATGLFGSASDCATYSDARALALSRCPAPDARLVMWSDHDWCALAVANDRAFGYAHAPSREIAEREALNACREYSHEDCRVAVAVSSQGTVTRTTEPSQGTGTYGAIAYSRSKGVFGSARGCATLAEAKRIALEGCNATDAEMVIWSRDEWCALAIAEDRTFGVAWGRSAGAAEQKALEHCRSHTTTPCRVAVVVDR